MQRGEVAGVSNGGGSIMETTGVPTTTQLNPCPRPNSALAMSLLTGTVECLFSGVSVIGASGDPYL